MLSELTLKLRDAVDEIFDGGGTVKAKIAIGKKIAAECPLIDLDYLLHYALCREDGSSAKIADMLASRSPPMSNTDREFLEGHCSGNQFGNNKASRLIGDAYKKQAESVGVSVTGKVYLGGLARFPGDPQAWVSDRGDVQRVLEHRGWGSEGSVNVAPREKPPKRERLLPKILEGGARKQLFKRLKAKGMSGDLLPKG